jgi:wobble nucleotide-excising tRNase
LEVKAGRFLTPFKTAGDQVFVYGREVNDFRSVDYDAIAMLNVSATQQLKREIQALQTENTALKAKLTAQDKRSTAQADEVASQNSRLVALEKLMNQAGAPETLSIKLGDP